MATAILEAPIVQTLLAMGLTTGTSTDDREHYSEHPTGVERLSRLARPCYPGDATPAQQEPCRLSQNRTQARRASSEYAYAVKGGGMMALVVAA